MNRRGATIWSEQVFAARVLAMRREAMSSLRAMLVRDVDAD